MELYMYWLLQLSGFFVSILFHFLRKERTKINLSQDVFFSSQHLSFLWRHVDANRPKGVSWRHSEIPVIGANPLPTQPHRHPSAPPTLSSWLAVLRQDSSEGADFPRTDLARAVAIFPAQILK